VERPLQALDDPPHANPLLRLGAVTYRQATPASPWSASKRNLRHVVPGPT
jgi:hypothetical protein